MTIMPAAGPLMVSSELLRNGVSMPPMTAVKMPAMGGTPEATEMPRQSGRAMRKTRKPERRSFFQKAARPERFPTGTGPAGTDGAGDG